MVLKLWLERGVLMTMTRYAPAAVAVCLCAGRNWIRIPTIMYGVHAATTVVPMLADFYYGQGRNSPQKEVLCMIYGTYLVIPMLIALTMAFSRIPFPAEKKKKVA
jgi:ABC-type phosphate transport system permease subunit